MICVIRSGTFFAVFHNGRILESFILEVICDINKGSQTVQGTLFLVGHKIMQMDMIWFTPTASRPNDTRQYNVWCSMLDKVSTMTLLVVLVTYLCEGICCTHTAGDAAIYCLWQFSQGCYGSQPWVV